MEYILDDSRPRQSAQKRQDVRTQDYRLKRRDSLSPVAMDRLSELENILFFSVAVQLPRFLTTSGPKGTRALLADKGN